ncbi:MAG TPA: HAMP domain-containing sensor histidine kinase [Acidimicrobiales bacterium]
MTFRARLVLVATGAVLVVVLLGAVATYVVAYDSLLGSVDVTLTQDARTLIGGNADGVLPRIENTCGRAAGYCSQMVWANGRVHPGDPTVLTISPAVAQLAGSQGTGSQLLFTTKVDGISVREIAYPLAGPYRYSNGTQPIRPLTMDYGGVLQVTVPLTGVNEGLHHLVVALWIIILIGVGLAVLLGLGVGRAVLAPLNDLTGTIEELARTTDVSRRLDPGGPDELGRLRRAFNRLLAALDSSRESQRQLVLDASHELRTPLTSLRTNMEVARRMEELAPEDRDILIGDVLTQLDELTSLVGDMAELARGEQPHQRQGPVRFDELVMTAVEAATTHGRNRNVTFAASVSPSWVLGSASRIERAVDNLLDNALKYSPDNGVVEVACADGVLVVRDHGPGVADADISHIFDRFYRAPEARSRPGSGLGLAIVAQVALDEGGQVSVHHAPGGGALFRLALPTIAAPHPSSTRA